MEIDQKPFEIDRKLLEKKILEELDSLTISNDFLFTKTMEDNPDICQHLIEEILGIKIKSIRYLEREKDLESRVDSKGIRLDVYVEDNGENRVFDIEMQTTYSHDLPKRTRYYQNLIDLDQLKPGEYYGKLGESYIIFICTFDHFHDNRRVYTIKSTCQENPKLPFEDGVKKIILNTRGTIGDVSEDLKSFLKYVQCGEISGNFVENLDKKFKNVKYGIGRRKEFMTYQMALLENRMHGQAEGRVEGLAEGRAEAQKSFAIEMLRDGEPVDKILKFTKLSIEKIHELSASIRKSDQSE